jgi:hypothetical protein
VIVGASIDRKDEMLRQIEEYRASQYFVYESEPDRKIPMKPITVTFRN